MNNEFNNPSDELKSVAEQINLLRKDLHTTLNSLVRIERRLKATFVNYPTKKKKSKEKKKDSCTKSNSTTPEELQRIFEDLIQRTENGGDSSFAARIEELTDEEIIALAVELGVGNSSNLSKRKSIEGIRMRIQEAILLQFFKKDPL